jgi:hypothetical protein
MILGLAEADDPLHVFFRRPGEHDVDAPCTGNAYVTFYSPRQSIPDRLAEHHYRFPIQGGSVYRSINAVLALIEEELGERDVTVHFGWPTSSWMDRIATGVLVAKIMRLPAAHPRLRFAIEHGRSAAAAVPPAAASA